MRGPKKDLHSGVFGGSVKNPLQVLCDLIAGMHDEDGRVTLPGFYDKVRDLSAKEREELLRAPYSDEEWKEETGVRALWGEKGYSTLERVGTRPTLEICGVTGGFTGEGAKTVIPARASAKILDPVSTQPGQRRGLPTTFGVPPSERARDGVVGASGATPRASVRGKTRLERHSGRGHLLRRGLGGFADL